MSPSDPQMPDFDERDFYVFLVGSLFGAFGVLFFGAVVGLGLLQAATVIFLLGIALMLAIAVITRYL